MFTDPLPGSLEFWLQWHLHGGFDGLVAIGMSEATIYRKIKAFREAYLVHPDEVKIPGVHVAFGHPYSDETGAPWTAKTHVDVVILDTDVWLDNVKVQERGHYVL